MKENRGKVQKPIKENSSKIKISLRKQIDDVGNNYILPSKQDTRVFFFVRRKWVVIYIGW